MKSIQQKIESLGGLDFVKNKHNKKIREQLISRENPRGEIIAFIDQYGFGLFNSTIGYKTLEKIPLSSADGLCGIEMIFGWANNVNGVKWNLERLQDEEISDYFPFAEGYPGDCICIGTSNQNQGKIYYWHHDDGEMYLVANSLTDFVASWELQPDEEIDLSGLVDFWIDDDL